MSVERYVHSQNGLEVEQSDLTLLSDAGGLADDKVLAELLRLAPYAGAGVSKAILPFGSEATVGPIGATGSVKVLPFRAIVGSRDSAANIGGLASWNDLRSAIFTAPNALLSQVQLGANTSGQGRWDLVYARLQVDAPGAQVSRYRKDPATEQVSVIQVSRSLVQSISVGVQAGTPGGPRPTLPADGGGTYFFPLANVRVPANFGPNSAVATSDIEELIPYVPLSLTTGACTLVPANHQYKEGGSVLSSAAFAWTAAGTRPGPVLPPTMSGSAGLLAALDLLSPQSANWSHQSLGLVDDSRNWARRVWRWFAMVSGTPGGFPWDPSNTITDRVVRASGQAPQGGGMTFGFGQSFWADGQGVLPAPTNQPLVALLTPSNAGLPANTSIALYTDGIGALRVAVSGAPAVRAFLWLEASGPFPNA